MKRTLRCMERQKNRPTYFKKNNEELMILPVRLKENPFYLKVMTND